jgi:hypothetical protein
MKLLQAIIMSQKAPGSGLQPHASVVGLGRSDAIWYNMASPAQIAGWTKLIAM